MLFVKILLVLLEIHILLRAILLLMTYMFMGLLNLNQVLLGVLEVYFSGVVGIIL